MRKILTRYGYVRIRAFRIPVMGTVASQCPDFTYRDFNRGFGLSISTGPWKEFVQKRVKSYLTVALLTVAGKTVKTLAVAILIGFHPITDAISVFAGTYKPRWNPRVFYSSS